MKLLTRYRVVIDTNVFISGLLFGGNAEKILQLFKKDKLRIVISPETLHELITKLYKFRLEEAFIDEFVDLMESKAIKIIPKKKIRLSRDEKDNMFLEVAYTGKADYLISGDKDLLSVKEIYKTQIVSPREFLVIISER